MSSSEGRVASGSAPQPVEAMAVDIAVGMELMTPSKKRAKPHGYVSPPSGSQFWVDDADSESTNDETNSSEDGFKTVDIKARRAARIEKKEKKKKMKFAELLDSLKRTSGTSGKARPNKLKVPRKVGKEIEGRCMPSAPTTAAVQPIPGASVAISIPRPNGPPAAQARIGRSAEDRLFIEFLGIPLTSVNAVKVRAELNKMFGPLSADVPAPSSTYVRVHLGGPEKGPNKTRLLACAGIAGYNIKVSEPREVVRHRGRYVQKVIKGVPSALSDEEILTCLREQESCTPLKVARILKMKDKVKIPTSVVKLDFAPGTVVPTRMYIGFQSFKIKEYIPAPTRCFRCMGLNHVAKHCQRKERCGICAGEHKQTECTQHQQPKCAACGGPHPAMSPNCPRYTLAKAATSISVREGVLYSDALRTARIQEKRKTLPTTSAPSARPSAPAAGRPATAERRDAGLSGESVQRSRPIPEVASELQAPAVASVQQAVEEIDDGKAQRAALDALTRACTMFVSAMEATECGSATLPAKIIQILVSTISVAFKIPQDTVCDAVSDIYAAAATPPDASSATSATTSDNRHH